MNKVKSDEVHDFLNSLYTVPRITNLCDTFAQIQNDILSGLSYDV
jgi:hypothetical protein